MQLPLLPRVHSGQHEALALIYPMTSQRDRRLVVRLWPADTVLRERGQPVWIGMVTQETIRRPLSWFNVPRDGKDFNQPREFLSENLSGLPLRLTQRREMSNPKDKQTVWDKQVLLAREPDNP